MKHICFDGRMIGKGGIGAYICHLLSGIKEAGFRLSVIAHPATLQKEPWLSKYELILSQAPIYSLREQMELPFLIPRSDIFFSPHYNIPLGPIRSKKRIVTIHDVFHLRFASTLRLSERIYAKVFLQQAVRRSDLVITNSYFSSREIVFYFPEAQNKIRPIQCGIDQKMFPKESNSSRVREIIEKFRLPKRFFLFVGNIKPHKNLKGLLLAMEEMGSEFSLVIVGKKEGMRNVETLENLGGRIQWHSTVANSELPIFYQLAESLVFPSFYEGFGLPPLEAMSCGCPVIASNVASIPEVCNEAALYVDPKNPKEIAHAMKKISLDEVLKSDLRKKGEVNVLRFPSQRTVQNHIEILNRIIL